MVDEYDFTIVYRACITETYMTSQKVGDITYHIGAESLNNIGHYEFIEDPVCNNVATVQLTNLPSFIQHNEAQSDFTLPQTSDLSLIGKYVVTIRSEI